MEVHSVNKKAIDVPFHRWRYHSIVIGAILMLSLVFCGQGRPPDPELHDAARRGDLNFVKAYVAKGGDPSIKNYHGNSALLPALAGHHYEVAEFLVQSGVSVNAVDKYSQRVTYPLIIGRDHEAIRWLIDKGLDPTIKDVHGQDELFLAAAIGDMQSIRMFLNASFDPNDKDVEGKHACDIASKNGHANAVQLLKQWMRENKE